MGPLIVETGMQLTDAGHCFSSYFYTTFALRCFALAAPAVPLGIFNGWTNESFDGE